MSKRMKTGLCALGVNLTSIEAVCCLGIGSMSKSKN